MQTLDQSKSYYRRITVIDIVTLLMIIGLMFIANGFLMSLLLIIVYPFSHSKVLVSDIRDKDIKIWVRKMDWDYYCKEHRIGRLMQYRSQSTVHMKQA
ncbi:hypothetical protein ACFQAV_01290 [Companilactobacillus huachuanensis]|uniref:Uncharacterized protein n=1 Tax=Companilactobacillus huachuanensis TaxID=2559914 RepID=A0ABW1RHF8_9LACO|nr:hypothetical protein [Companilactobacillus huachuanensis]